jgi:type I restriction enzyme M protein
VPNERITESIVRDHFRLTGGDDLVIEEQMSTAPALARALREASKQGPGAGKPEFILTHPNWPDIVLLVECKADANFHESPRHKAAKESTAADIAMFAVDGVLHYAKHVAKHRNVIAVAVSGQSKSKLRISTYRQIQGAPTAEPLLDREGRPLDKLAKNFADYSYLFNFDPAVVRDNIERLKMHTREVHNFLRDYAKVTEAEKPLVISAVLLALQNQPFRKSWSVTQDTDLATFTYEALEKSVKKAISNSKKELMMAAYSFLQTHPELTKPARIRIKGRQETNESPLRYLISDLETEVLPFAETYPEFDVIGQFYAEFLRYTGGDGKGLGIVLTPRHLTELFVDVAQIGKQDTVLDPCAGTGGFLISAMTAMDRQTHGNADEQKGIRTNQLIGIEQQSMMFALCVSNMILRGDGKSNLHRGDCFDPKLQQQITHPRAGMNRPNKGLINPPYSQKGEEQHELDFVNAMMDMLAPGGIGVAVVPMSCALALHPARVRLLESHTLVAAMSLPGELFYPVGTTTTTLVLRAHTPHETTDAPTWFGYWRDDGYVKLKHLGRVDLNFRWDKIKAQWLSDYRSMAEIPGRCVKRRVTVNDEWCAEAYLETDYSTLMSNEFEKIVRDYAIFRLVVTNRDGNSNAKDGEGE